MAHYHKIWHKMIFQVMYKKQNTHLYFFEHMSLSLVHNCDGGRSLLPWFSINLDWDTLVNYDLCECVYVHM